MDFKQHQKELFPGCQIQNLLMTIVLINTKKVQINYSKTNSPSN